MMLHTAEIMRIFIPTTIAFLIGIGITPFLTHFLYQRKMWKPKGGKVAFDGKPAEVFNQLHQTRETGTPRFGGVIVWGSVLLTAGLLSLLSVLFPDAFSSLAFISRNQTWLPLAALVAGALVGLIDDLFEVQGKSGLKLRVRLFIVAIIALFSAIWFYHKLGVSAISFPFLSQPLELGPWFIAFFVLTALFIYAGGVIDGIDGLAGGLFSIMFAAYAGIAFFQNQLDIAALAGAIAGGLLAFVWFNIPPARFYLSETGTMGLTLALVVIAFLTDTLGHGRGITVLPVIALPLVATVISNLLQIFWKKVFRKKLLKIAPLHHHFEAIGWPAYKVTMRYWIVGVIVAIIGMSIALL
jgi:phospho-N-acetylmuramoyl-pentapeptide-transferase